MTQWVECVPNFSEGSRTEVIDSLVDAITSADGSGRGSARILDVSADRWHNRSVITYAVPVDDAVATALSVVRRSMELIDLRSHTGVHPRFGATDVFPFVPLGNTTISQCVNLARELASRVALELEVPVFLYEDAALLPERRNLAEVRRTLRDTSSLKPDLGPSVLHPSFGAIAIGARKILVAFNVYLGDSGSIKTAAAIARQVRESSGGLSAVKAIPLLVDQQAQVSMNLVDIDVTSMRAAYEKVAALALEHGASVTRSEIVGLVPERAFAGATPAQLKLPDFDTSAILERRVHQRIPELQSVGEWLSAVAAPTSSPAGGQAAAYSAATAAALLEMLAGIAMRKSKNATAGGKLQEIIDEASRIRGSALLLGAEDAEAYADLEAALSRTRRASPEKNSSRSTEVSQAAIRATAIPLKVARIAARVGGLVEELLPFTSESALPDCAVAAMLASTAARGSQLNVKANATLLHADAKPAQQLHEASQLADAADKSELNVRKKL